MAGFNPVAALYAGMKIKKGPASISPRTPPFAGGGLYKPSPDPGNQFNPTSDDNYTPDEARLRDLIAHPPQEGVKENGQKIGGLRRVLGGIASTVGPMIGGPAVAGLGDKLLYPGRDKYNADVARAQVLAQLSGRAEDRKDREANREDMRFNRTAATNARQDALDERKRVDAQAQINNITGPGKGWEIPDAPTIPESRQVLKPQMPTAVGHPAPAPQIATQNVQGPSPVEQMDDVTGKPLSEVGTVKEVQVPGQQRQRFIRPNANTLRGFDVKKKEDELAATRTEEITPAMLDAATALKMTGLPAAGKVTPTVYTNFQTTLRMLTEQKNKPAAPSTPEHMFIEEYQKLHPGATVAQALHEYAANGQAPQRPEQTMVYIPDGNGGMTARLVTPGQTVPAGAVTASGMSSQNTPTASTRTMTEAAPKVTSMVDRVSALVEQQKAALGPAASRWNEFMAGKVGAPNPEFTKLRTDVGLLTTMLMRMHVGARGGEKIMEHFKDLIDVSKQSPENLQAALQEIKQYAVEVAHSGGTTSESTPQAMPKVGEIGHNGGRVLRITPIKE